MNETWIIVIATMGIIALSAFFVAVEFALMAAKPHRLESQAHSAAGRAALRNSAELTLLLAGSQLGITVCTLALGAVTNLRCTTRSRRCWSGSGSRWAWPTPLPSSWRWPS